ncbi:MAG: 50S ribosomal protein L9 [Eggerthellaceae bacterium]|nr:50S ribosomal protein L9 [Eggerthellaceae bacterium]
MEVILLKELRGRGGEGDVINVARGFANNYLFRQGYAVKATPGNLKQLEQKRNNIQKREEVRLADANKLAEQLEGTTVNIMAQVGEEGQLFGSVTAPMIAEAIAEQFDLEIDRRRVELGKPIKAVGTYQVPVGFYRDIKATVNVVVTGDTVEDAEANAEAAEDAVVEALEEAVGEEGAEIAIAEAEAEATE